jgi:predicted Zn-dependent protease
MDQDLTDRDEFRRLADVALEAARADHVFVSLRDTAGGTTRFARNQIVQNVHTREHVLTVTAAFGRQAGTTSTTDLSARAVAAAVRRAEEIARVSPADPEHLPPLPPQEYPERHAFDAPTAAAGPSRLLDETRAAIDLCAAEGLEAAGITAAYASSVGVAADTGLFAHELRTRAEFSLTATAADSSGWVKSADRSLDRLGVAERTRVAIDKAKRSAGPIEVPAGRHTVILEPAAVAGLLGPLLSELDAKSYHRGTSPVRGKLGKPVIDRRLSLRNAPRRPELLGGAFDGSGLPGDEAMWIDAGVLVRLAYDRFTAKEHGVAPTYRPDAPLLEGTEPRAGSVDDLVKETERGILVTNFWYIRYVNPTDLTLTGMTRDGTFLVEDGEVKAGLINFRWHESPLAALNRVEAYTPPADAITSERAKMLLPALKLREFNFSSVTRF